MCLRELLTIVTTSAGGLQRRGRPGGRNKARALPVVVWNQLCDQRNSAARGCLRSRKRRN